MNEKNQGGALHPLVLKLTAAAMAYPNGQGSAAELLTAQEALEAALSPSEQPEPVAWFDQKTLDFLRARPKDQSARVSVIAYGIGLVKKTDVGAFLYTQPNKQTGEPDPNYMFGVTGASDEVEALACAIWAHRCPGLLMDEDDDRPHYMDAARAAFAALDGASKQTGGGVISVSAVGDLAEFESEAIDAARKAARAATLAAKGHDALIGLQIEARPMHKHYAVMAEITEDGADAILAALSTNEVG